jgi:tellurite resistance protein TehA-like permease
MLESGRTSDNVARPLPSAALQPLSVLRFIAAWLGRKVYALDPDCFAIVMATGIISNAFFLQGERTFADVLFAITLVVYPSLWLLTILRAARFHAAIRTDLLNPRRVFLFFTTVAATNVLGTAIGLRGFATVALALWLLAFVLWFVLIYLGFGVLAFVNTAGRADVIEGGWLNAIVGTQSLVILGALFVLPATNAVGLTAMLLHMLWMLGLVLYAIFVALLSYRIFFVALKPDDLTPPLWIVMGAAAISVNAGSLLMTASGTPFLHAVEPFVEGVTLALWVWATWWIPMLILFGIWKHVIHGVPIAYSTKLWSIVFPLGMYTVATLRLSRVADIPVLASWSLITVWIAFAAWVATFIGLATASVYGARTLLRSAQRFRRAVVDTE